MSQRVLDFTLNDIRSNKQQSTTINETKNNDISVSLFANLLHEKTTSKPQPPQLQKTLSKSNSSNSSSYEKDLLALKQANSQLRSKFASMVDRLNVVNYSRVTELNDALEKFKMLETSLVKKSKDLDTSESKNRQFKDSIQELVVKNENEQNISAALRTEVGKMANMIQTLQYELENRQEIVKTASIAVAASAAVEKQKEAVAVTVSSAPPSSVHTSIDTSIDASAIDTSTIDDSIDASTDSSTFESATEVAAHTCSEVAVAVAAAAPPPVLPECNNKLRCSIGAVFDANEQDNVRMRQRVIRKYVDVKSNVSMPPLMQNVIKDFEESFFAEDFLYRFKPSSQLLERSHNFDRIGCVC